MLFSFRGQFRQGNGHNQEAVPRENQQHQKHQEVFQKRGQFADERREREGRSEEHGSDGAERRKTEADPKVP